MEVRFILAYFLIAVLLIAAIGTARALLLKHREERRLRRGLGRRRDRLPGTRETFE